MIGELARTILDELWDIPIFDVHSHFCGEEGPVRGVDEYIAGWTQPETPGNIGPSELRGWRISRWPMKKSLWIGRAFFIALQELYRSNDRTTICAKMNEVRAGGLLGSMEWMRQRSNVDYLVVDSNPELAAKLRWVRSTYRLDARAITGTQGDLGRRIAEVEEKVSSMVAAGRAHCLKIPIAYDRSLEIGDVGLEKASDIVAKESKHRTSQEAKEAEDHVYRHFFRKAGDWSIPVEVHTGFGWAIGKRPLRLCEADPENLLPVLEDPEMGSTKFILFHGGYPFLSKAAYLAGSFSNVYLDFTCLCQESWTMLKAALHEWIDVVPMDRIVSGSDGSYEWLYFAAKINRECLAHVLAEKVTEEFMDIDLALEIGGRILRENALAIFQRR